MIRTAWVRSAALLGTFAAIALFALAAAASANVPLTRVSADPFTNPTSQHATEVEPDTFAFGVDRPCHLPGGPVLQRRGLRHRLCPFNRRRRDLGHSSFLPGLTFNAAVLDPSNPFERVSDPSVAYDATHNTWLISSIPLLPSLVPDGLRQPLDRRRRDVRATRCRSRRPPQEGRPRQELDGLRQPPGQPVLRQLLHGVRQLRQGDLEYMSTSSDGGRTWTRRFRPPATPRASAVSPSCSPTAPSSCRSRACKAPSATSVDRRRCDLVAARRDLEGSASPELRRPAHEPAAERRDRRRRNRLRGVGRLPLRAEVLGERHRVQLAPPTVSLEPRQPHPHRPSRAAASITSSLASPSTRPRREPGRTWR